MRQLAIVALAVLGVTLAPRTALAYQAGALVNHAHSSTAGDGGSAITPKSVVVSTFVAVSSFTANAAAHFANNVTIDGTLSVPGGITGPISGAQSITVATVTQQVNFQGTLIGGSPSNNSFTTANGAIGYWMKSLDGATQSSGCVVTVGLGDFAGGQKDEPSTMVFTSSTTGSSLPPSVLLETCAPGAFCRVAMFGPVRAQCTSGLFAVNNPIEMLATRCLAQTNNIGNQATGHALSTCVAGNGWVFLGGH